MKTPHLSKTMIALAGYLLLNLVPAHAGVVPLTRFDDPADAPFFSWANWSAPAEAGFDATLDAGGGAVGSGSLRITNHFPNNPGGYNQCVFYLNQLPGGPIGPIDAEALYAKFSCDVRLDPSVSYPRVNNQSYGYFELIVQNQPGYVWNSLAATSLTNGNWVHVEGIVKAPADNLSDIIIKLGENNLTNDVVYNIDNITWTEIPPPVVPVTRFDNPADAPFFTWANWSAPAEAGFDATLDAGGGAVGSGSLRITNHFPNSPNGYNQCVFYLNQLPGGPIGPLDAETLYSTFSCDVRLDPSVSYPRANNQSYGYFELIVQNQPGYVWNTLAGASLTDGNWQHVEGVVKAPANNISDIIIKLGENNLTNDVVYNLDNITWTETKVVIPPPIMAIENSKPGLNLLAGTPGQYDRQSIQSVANSYGWIDSADPVSYSVTISSFPNAAAYGSFQVHMYLVPGTPGTEPSPDWNQPSVVFCTIQASASGGGTNTFHYKTNAPNSNGPGTLNGGSMYFNDAATNGPVGQLGFVAGANVLGTWTVTFSQNTNITLRAPDGATTSFVMPPEDAAFFAGGITVYFGVQPNQLANVGQTAVLGGVEVKAGAATLLTDNFSVSPLDSATWNVRAQQAACVVVVAPADLYWASWTTPSSGYTIETNATLNATSWGSPGLTDVLIGTRKRVLIPGSALPGTGQGYFRVAKP